MSIYRNNETIRILNSMCNVSIANFNDRLRLQKIAFLSQKMGSVGGFTFSWYKHGPYSPSLTEALYQCYSMGELGEKQELSQNEKLVIGKLRDLLGKNIDAPSVLELFASVWYLLPNRKLTENDVNRIIEIMRDQKPQYSPKEVKDAIKKITEFKK